MMQNGRNCIGALLGRRDVIKGRDELTVSVRIHDVPYPHSVCSPKPALCSERYFFHYDFLKVTYKGSDRMANEPIGIVYISAVGLLLLFISSTLADVSTVEHLQLDEYMSNQSMRESDRLSTTSSP
jgi:hypothetical protein